jgi:hypothetical protein
MKAESVTKGIINSLNRIVESLRKQFAFEFNAIPHFTRVTEKFDVVQNLQNYKIRDGF